MKKHSGIIIAGSIIVVLGLVIFLLRKKIAALIAGTPTKEIDKKTTDNTKKQTYPVSVFPLVYGSTGASVMALQKVVGVKVDGDWGPDTEAALKAHSLPTYYADQADVNSAITNQGNIIHDDSSVTKKYPKIRANANIYSLSYWSQEYSIASKSSSPDFYTNFIYDSEAKAQKVDGQSNIDMICFLYLPGGQEEIIPSYRYVRKSDVIAYKNS